jgi:Zn-dependent protease
MPSRQLTVLRIAGIPLRFDASWVIIAVVLTWSLANRFALELPLEQHPELTTGTYWAMATVVALVLFLCVILHELGHSLVGQHYGLRIRAITLFVFGGVAALEGEPRAAKAEFWMAVAGPVVSIFLAAIFWLVFLAGTSAGWHVAVLTILRELAVINAVLLGFNLLPALPLDGGRVLRAILWASTGNLYRATAVAAQLGQVFGLALLLLGLFSLLAGHPMAGLWWLLLGWILRSAAQSSYGQVVIRGILGAEPVRRFMTAKVSCVPPDLSIEHLVEDYVYQQHHQLYPVCAQGRLRGYVTPREIKRVPREAWSRHRVAEIMASDIEAVQIAPETDALDALARMQRTGESRLLVVEQGSLVGILTLKDLLDYLSLKLELEQA